jgi:hypothetical protein
MLVDLLRRLARPLTAATLVASVAAAAIALAPAPAGAASGNKTTFAAAVDRSALVIVATVQDAPTVSAGYRLAIEKVLKGTAGSGLTYSPDPMAVALEPGQRVVLLLTDPSGLDFRGTTVLLVAADGSIDPDGLTAVPATLAELEATFDTPPASIPPTTTTVPAAPPARDPIALVVLVGASILAGAAVVLAWSALARRRRA